MDNFINHVENYKLPFLRELCHIANERNKINQRRSKARWRRSYWLNAIKILEAYKEDNSELRRLKAYQPIDYDKKVQAIKATMQSIRHRSPHPKKWMTMGIMKLRANVLKAEADYAQAKYDTLLFSESTTERVRELCGTLNVSMHHDNGYIIAIRTKRPIEGLRLKVKDIEKYALQYETDKAVEEMIEE